MMDLFLVEQKQQKCQLKPGICLSAAAEEAAGRSPDTAFSTFRTEPRLCRVVPLEKITTVGVCYKTIWLKAGEHPYQGCTPGPQG